MKQNIQTFMIYVVLALLSTSVARAATVSAVASVDTLSLNESAQISLFLNLDPTEEASVFEGVFNLNGLGSVADAALNVGGPTWSSSFGNIVGDQALLSLTSNNDSTSSRLLGVLDVLALSPGVFEVVFDANTFASFDIDVSPFVQDLALSNFDGQVLASVAVVPVPPALVLFLSGLSGLSIISRRRGKKTQSNQHKDMVKRIDHSEALL